jgi:proteasome activator subunit 4
MFHLSALPDWLTSFLRRIFALYENLPEEGGKSLTAGGRTEESVLKSLRSALDMVLLHLSEPLFDLVLNLVYEYATTNARSNAVKAFGQLIGCLGRANPTKTANKFLPYCVAQIKEELKHGASATRTTSSAPAQPSDTTLHWSRSRKM